MNSNTEKDGILVFYASQARELLKHGYTIIDVKLDKRDPERKRTVFVFKNENGLIEKIKELREKELSQREKAGHRENERKYTTRKNNMAI